MNDADATPKPGKLVAAEKAEIWISRLTAKFRTPPRKYLDTNLPIPSNLPTACLMEGQHIKTDFSNLLLSRDLAVLTLFENTLELYSTTLGETLDYLKHRESWEDYDICVFDESLAWCLGISHNDTITFVHNEPAN